MEPLTFGIPAPTGGQELKFTTRTALYSLLWLIVISLYFVVRYEHLIQVLNSPPGRILIIDSLYYNSWAMKIYHGLGLGPTVFFMSPLYPMFIALAKGVAGESTGSVLFFQLILSFFTLLLIGRFTSKRFGASAGVLAGLFYSLYTPGIYYDSVFLSTTLILFLTMTALTFLDITESRGGRLWVILAGLAIGLSSLARPNSLILLPFFGFVFIKKWKKYGFEQFLFLAVAAMIVVFPAMLRNFMLGGEWYLTTNSAGVNMYIGNNQAANGLYWEAPWLSSAEPSAEAGDYRAEAERRLEKNLSIGSASTYWMTQSIAYIVTHPVEWMILQAKKIAYFFNRVEAPNNVSFYGVKEYSSVLRKLWLFNFGWIAPFALVGLLISRREQGSAFAWAVVLAFLTSALLFFVSGEYRYPIMGVMIAYGAGAITRTFHQLRHKEIEPAQISMIILLVLLMFCNVPWKTMKIVSNPKMDYFNWASTSFAQNDLPNAALLFTAAIAWEPTWIEPHLQLAQVYDEMNLTELADREYEYAGISREQLQTIREQEEIAEVVNPDSLASGSMNSKELTEVGIRFNQLQKFEQAGIILARAARMDTTNYEARFQFAFALENTRQFEQAKQVYTELEFVQDEDPLIPYRIAHVEYYQGNRGNAMSTLRRVKYKASRLSDPESKKRWLEIVKQTESSFMNF